MFKSILLVVFMLFTMTAFAQQQSVVAEDVYPEVRAQQQTEVMVKMLQLNDQQSKQLYKLNLAENHKYPMAKPVQTVTRANMSQVVDGIEQDRDKLFTEILSPEQQEIWQKVRRGEFVGK